MPITVTCACGRAFPMPEFMAGQSVKCTACGKDVAIPATDAPAARPAPVETTAIDRIQLTCKCGNKIKARKSLAQDGVPCERCGATVRLDASGATTSTAAPAPAPKLPPPAPVAVAP